MSSEESFLSQRIILAFLVLEACNWSILFLGSYMSDYFLLDVVGSFVFGFATRGAFFLFIVPVFLKIPYGKRTFAEYLSDVKLTQFRPAGRNAIITISMFVILLGSLALAAVFYGNFIFDVSIILSENSPMLLLAVNAGLWEEIMWRGIFLTLLLRKFSIRTSIATNTVLFALSHLINLITGRDIIVMIGQLIFVLIATPLMAYVFIRTESLWTVIVLHYSVDAFSPLFMYSMIQPGPNLIVGGIFMLAGWFIGNILAFAFLKIYLKDNSITAGDSNEN